ncbi:phage virion morphogenesis protein [Serratia fonticola]|uniref:phage virion morphogenesis protein n=1 Tax=Serratia fonticola TaxID=47917 RepID=UPI00164719AD|nr:phage virion morphogenesis protein [Serratia fonticola]MBC3252852.1 phage virion morphogenesis protein [Serratia fonticola]
MITIKVDSADFVRRMDHMLDWLSHREPLMRAIAAEMKDAVEENFAQQGRPAWLGIKRDGMILQKSGRLASSIVAVSDNDSATVGTNVEYAAIHQFGGKTRPHVILPRNKKALAFNGRVVKKVNHPGSDIPARPFLALTSDDEEKIVSTVSEYLYNALL